MNDEYVIYDAKDKILGRFCSQIAKKALLGEKIIIINSKDAIISGNRRQIHDNYLSRLNIKTSTNPTRGPFHERRPDTFMRRVIKQMLPRKKLRGKQALKKIHIYVGDIPERFKKRYPKVVEREIPKSDKNRLFYYNKFITLEELCNRIGGWINKEIEA